MALDYANKERSYELFDKAKRRGTWDPADIDLGTDREQWETVFTDEQREAVLGTCVAFYEGEESVTKTLTPFLTAIEAMEDPPFDPVQQELFLTTQLFEEAKHTDFFARYFEEVFGTQQTDVDDYEESDYWQNPELRHFLIDDLEAVTTELRHAADAGDQRHLRFKFSEATMHYMGLVEAQLAKTGYVIFDEMLESAGEMAGVEVLPGFREGIRLVRNDEGRHISNGRWLLALLAEEDPEIVTEVYEPKIQDYVDRLTGNEEPEDGEVVVDRETTREVVNRNLRQTIEEVGEEHFERFDASVDVDRVRQEAAD